MGKLRLLRIVICSTLLAGTGCRPQVQMPKSPPGDQGPRHEPAMKPMIPSHLGHESPAFAPGMMPSKLGWGPDDKPYPHKFVVDPKDGAEMVWVPPGEFTMGSPEGEGDKDEHPQHKVRITKGFWLGKREVTNAQYRAFCQATGRQFLSGSSDGPKHPVAYLSWEDAKAYCDHYGLGLPTEAQWEYAARGPQSLRYPWGNEWDPRKCCNKDNQGTGDSRTMEVGSLPAGDSWCGASDMAGNVLEWCADWYHEGYYAKSPGEDPPGSSSGLLRLLRGGSWGNVPLYCRSACRFVVNPLFRLNYGDFGFRCARTP